MQSPKVESPFRGQKQILEIRARVAELARYLDLIGKPEADLHLSAKDYDMVMRWPRAASLSGFTVVENNLYFEQRRCLRHEGEGRYSGGKRKTPPQAAIWDVPA